MEYIDAKQYRRKTSSSLAVVKRDRELIARSQDPNLTLDLPKDPKLAFAEIVFRQLAPFLTKSQVQVLLNASADDAQKLANQRREPVALVDESGRVLALREPTT